jgi:hypothetical protein
MPQCRTIVARLKLTGSPNACNASFCPSLLRGDFGGMGKLGGSGTAANQDVWPVHRVVQRVEPRVGRCLVARRLGLSPYTINGYVKNLYCRFGVNSRGELMARFVGER